MLAGCSIGSVTEMVSPYRINIRQGNYVDQSMIAQLKRGMTPDQVRFVLGSPLIVDVFHEGRWDYVYRYRTGEGVVSQRKISIFFVDGKLDSVDGDVEAGDAVGLAESLRQDTVRVIEIPGSASEKPVERKADVTDKTSAAGEPPSDGVQGGRASSPADE